jgi:hypothetical protein
MLARCLAMSTDPAEMVSSAREGGRGRYVLTDFR